MVGHARYPALDRARIASQSRPIIEGVLRAGARLSGSRRYRLAGSTGLARDGLDHDRLRARDSRRRGSGASHRARLVCARLQTSARRRASGLGVPRTCRGVGRARPGAESERASAAALSAREAVIRNKSAPNERRFAKGQFRAGRLPGTRGGGHVPLPNGAAHASSSTRPCPPLRRRVADRAGGAECLLRTWSSARCTRAAATAARPMRTTSSSCSTAARQRSISAAGRSSTHPRPGRAGRSRRSADRSSPASSSSCSSRRRPRSALPFRRPMRQARRTSPTPEARLRSSEARPP